jgi:hypothetical protein
VQVLEEQVLERGGGYSVDIKLVDEQLEGKWLGVVVEADGPSHVLRGVDKDTRAINGNTRLKRRLLTALGLMCRVRDPCAMDPVLDVS